MFDEICKILEDTVDDIAGTYLFDYEDIKKVHDVRLSIIRLADELHTYIGDAADNEKVERDRMSMAEISAAIANVSFSDL